MTLEQHFLRIGIVVSTVWKQLLYRTLLVFSLVTTLCALFPSDSDVYDKLYSFTILIFILGVFPRDGIQLILRKTDKVTLSHTIKKLLLDIYSLIVVLNLQPSVVEKMLHENKDVFLIITIKLMVMWLLFVIAIKFIGKEICSQRNRTLLKLIKTSETVYETGRYTKSLEREYQLIGVPVYYTISEYVIRAYP